MDFPFFQRPTSSSHRKWIAVIGLTLFFGCGAARAGETDWPQWRGPQRDGKAAPQPLLQSWPEGGPVKKWQLDDAGRGYSSVACVDGRLFTMGSKESKCHAICLDATDGSVIWETQISRAGTSQDYATGWGAGPRSTPTVAGDQVFVLSDLGVIAALDQTDGTVQWSVDLVERHGGNVPRWGYSESVLVDGDRVMVTPGSDEFMIGLDRQSGKKVWQSDGVDAPAHYVSMLKSTVGETAYYVTAAGIGLVAFDCRTGEKLFENPNSGNRIATIPTPIVSGSLIYHTSNYGAGNVLLKLSGGQQRPVQAEQLYHLTGKTMTNHHGGGVLVDGVIYGFTKVSGGTWMAQDLETGETLWNHRENRNKSGSLCFGDGRLYCYNDRDGTVILVEPNRQAWIPHGKLELPKQTELPRGSGAIWAHPVIADQTLYIRDQELIFAYDIAR